MIEVLKKSMLTITIGNILLYFKQQKCDIVCKVDSHYTLEIKQYIKDC